MFALTVSCTCFILATIPLYLLLTGQYTHPTPGGEELPAVNPIEDQIDYLNWQIEMLVEERNRLIRTLTAYGSTVMEGADHSATTEFRQELPEQFDINDPMPF